MNILSTVSLILGIILSLVSIITLIVNAIKNKHSNNKALAEGMKAILRNSIEKIYYANLENKTLREYERKNLDSLYAAYHDGLKGNSFASDIYEEMRTWEVTR